MFNGLLDWIKILQIHILNNQSFLSIGWAKQLFNTFFFSRYVL